MALTEDRLPPVADRAAERDVPDPAAARARLRALRAERLARLHAAPAPAPIPAPAPEAPPAPSAAGSAPRPAPEDLADPEALVAFLRALTGDAEPHTEPLDVPRPAAEVLHFHRPVPVDPAPDPPVAEASQEPEATPAETPVLASDLDRLPGIGPGLLWALGQAGITRLADLAPLAPEDLAARLGPLGQLVPAATWIAAARAAEA